MSLPDPEPGLVIRYSYLWRREQREGREEGAKDRPCAIVLVAEEEDGETLVVVLPITHRSPDSAAAALELPPAIKRRLGLDDERSWVVLTESNQFGWPGPDLRRGEDGSVVYGSCRRGFSRKSSAAFSRSNRRRGRVRSLALNSPVALGVL